MFPTSFDVTGRIGQVVIESLTVSNSFSADGDLVATIDTRETGRHVLAQAGAGVGMPEPYRDFGSIQAGAAHVAERLLVRFAADVQGDQRAASIAALGGSVLKTFSLVPGLVAVALPPDQSVKEALGAYNAAAGVISGRIPEGAP